MWVRVIWAESWGLALTGVEVDVEGRVRVSVSGNYVI